MAICAFYVYLAFHALSGTQGLMSWADYNADIKRLGTELETVREDRARLEFQVEALRGESLNRDLLDIRAREKTFVSGANETTIWLDP